MGSDQLRVHPGEWYDGQRKGLSVEGMRTNIGERGEWCWGRGGMEWRYGGDGYGVMEGMRHREMDRNIGTQTRNLRRGDRRGWKARGTEWKEIGIQGKRDGAYGLVLGSQWVRHKMGRKEWDPGWKRGGRWWLARRSRDRKAHFSTKHHLLSVPSDPSSSFWLFPLREMAPARAGCYPLLLLLLLGLWVAKVPVSAKPKHMTSAQWFETQHVQLSPKGCNAAMGNINKHTAHCKKLNTFLLQLKIVSTFLILLWERELIH